MYDQNETYNENTLMPPPGYQAPAQPATQQPVAPPPVEQPNQPAPPPPVNPFVRQMTPQEVDTVNEIIRKAEGITRAMQNAWGIRDSMRQVIADMVCPWRVGECLILGAGTGPLDKRIVTAVLPGKTEEGQFYRVKTRALKKGKKPGEREMLLKLEGEIVSAGMYEGELPARAVDVEAMEV